jgi:hypothetical protein
MPVQGYAMQTKQAGNSSSAAAIFSRLWETDEGDLSPVLARHLVKVQFSKRDLARMHNLAARNQEGRLTSAETEELDNHVTVADLLAILQSNARKVLGKRRGMGKANG